MDLSKLPRMSKTDPPPADAPAAACPACGEPLRPDAKFCDRCGAAVGAGAVDYALRFDPPPSYGEAWISLGLGAIFLFVSPRFFQWLAHPSRTDFDATDTATGAVIPYMKSAFFWSDAGPALFAVALIFEGLVILFARKKPLIVVSLVVTAAAVLANVVAVVQLQRINAGFPLASGLAVVFGGYIAWYEWRLLQAK